MDDGVDVQGHTYASLRNQLGMRLRRRRLARPAITHWCLLKNQGSLATWVSTLPIALSKSSHQKTTSTPDCKTTMSEKSASKTCDCTSIHGHDAKMLDDSSSTMLSSVPSSTSTVVPADKATILSSIADVLERMESKPLIDQRYQPSAEKMDTFNNLALIAKIERALGRRLTSQDFVPSGSSSAVGGVTE
ncbi:hypothetical protein V1505DRAFT_40200 [Lipomyces doorenjongii]